MFSWCFKCQNTDDENEYHQRPKTRNNSNNNSQKSSKHAAIHPTTITTSTNDVVESREKSVEEMQKECLEAHNRYRAKHGASPLTLNKQLNAYATEWAKKLAKSNTLQHRKNNKYGENLYLGTNMGPQTHELAVKAWYEEIKDYNFNKPGFSSNTGHFTQVVWKSSKELGVGILTKDNRTWIVCNYNPPGNMMGNYKENVAPLLVDTAAKIIDKMKPQKMLLKRPLKPETDDKDENDTTKKRYSAKDLKLWSQFELECLDSHNKYRAIHGSPAMKLNRKLCNLALDWSKQLAKQRSLQHRPHNDYGENIYYAMNFEPSAEQCVKSWYDEIKNYNYSKPGFSSQTGHFTQVVWKESIELGVGITTLNNMTFVVCNYNPPGNVMSQYDDQVPKPGSKPTTSINTKASTSITKQPKIEDQQQQTFEEVCLDSHNSLRALHGSPAMSLNKNLNLFASDWAEVRTRKITYSSRTGTTQTTTTTIIKN
ncbi:uncharacterized protein ACRADG_004848 [Cochliomyia hominivorax]